MNDFTDPASSSFLFAYLNMYQGQVAIGYIFDCDVELSAERHRLPVFQNLTLLIGGDLGAAAEHQQVVGNLVGSVDTDACAGVQNEPGSFEVVFFFKEGAVSPLEITDPVLMSFAAAFLF